MTIEFPGPTPADTRTSLRAFTRVKEVAPEYNVRDVDIPFYRLQKGKLKFFAHTNNKSDDTTSYTSKLDNANQGACGIPYNAYWTSTVAIHPYWLKYAGLDRYCMQDVCISFWQTKHSWNQHPNDTDYRLLDMMLKVTDICSTNPDDPTHCATPSDIKIDRVKAQRVNALPLHDNPQGPEYPDDFHWFFMKCWDDGLVQPAYNTTKNWFTQPPLLNDVKVQQTIALQQYNNNQIAYPKKGWPTYPNGAYRPEDQRYKYVFNNTDWHPGHEPAWNPIAGGAQHKDY